MDSTVSNSVSAMTAAFWICVLIITLIIIKIAIMVCICSRSEAEADGDLMRDSKLRTINEEDYIKFSEDNISISVVVEENGEISATM